jgi:glycosyltransferase involved in cell wall biosynthesis
MRIIFDASNHQLYPIGGDGFTSGTVVMVRQIARGLAERGHTVHVITNDLETEEQRGPGLWYWPPDNHPTLADVAVQLMHVNPAPGYDAPILLLATFGLDPFLGRDHRWAAMIDGFPLLSAKHGELLRLARPTIAAQQCFVTGLGVDLEVYRDSRQWMIGSQTIQTVSKVPGRLLYANDPARGLLPLLDIFDRVREQVPDASLHIAYDFAGNLERVRWQHSYLAQMLLECERRIETTPGIVNLGALTREQIIREQLECQVHVMPSTAERDQLHGLTQLECAAAGCALVLSDVCAFPEVFGAGATILPQVGQYIPEAERRVTPDDWAGVVVALLKDGEKWQEESRKARALAEGYTWDKVIDRWEKMIEQLREGKVG